MYELKKKIGKVFTSKFVGTGPSSYEKRIYQATVSQGLRNNALHNKSVQEGNLCDLTKVFVFIIKCHCPN